MKTKNNKKSTKKVAKKSVKTNTVNGIETLPSGSYRVRKTVNGVKHSFITSKCKDAIAFRDTLKSI